MRICIFTHTFPRFKGDTAAPFMETFAQGFLKLGHEVIVLTPYDPLIKYDRDCSLVTYKYIFPRNLHRLGYSRTLRGDKKLKLETYLLSPFMFLFGFIALLRLVRDRRIDVVSTHWIVPNGFLTALVSLFVPIKWTVTIPGSDVYLGTKNFLFAWMVSFAARRANTVLSDSRHYLDQLKSLGFYPKNTKVIRYGVDIDRFKPRRKDNELLKILGLKTDTPIIVAVGRFVAKKGFIFLLEAMPKVVDKIKDVKLVLVGDGDQKEQLMNKVKSLKIGGNVVFPGTISYDQLAKYYNLGDVFVMPSIKDEEGNIDASPVAMMEAMCCGTPVVATSFSGSSDLVVKGKTGYLVKEKDSEEIAKGVISILSQKDRKKVKENVRRLAIENFSNISVAKAYVKLYSQMI